MIRQFSLLRLRKQAATWEFPITHDEFLESPLAGPFDEVTMQRLDAALARFPFAERSRSRRRAWNVAAPGGGQVEVWLSSDGTIWLEGATTLNLIYGLYVHLLAVVPDLGLEDGITGVIHNRRSLLRLVRRDEAKRLPFELGDDPFTTPPLAA